MLEKIKEYVISKGLEYNCNFCKGFKLNITGFYTGGMGDNDYLLLSWMDSTDKWQYYIDDTFCMVSKYKWDKSPLYDLGQCIVKEGSYDYRLDVYTGILYQNDVVDVYTDFDKKECLSHNYVGGNKINNGINVKTGDICDENRGSHLVTSKKVKGLVQLYKRYKNLYGSEITYNVCWIEKGGDIEDILKGLKR